MKKDTVVVTLTKAALNKAELYLRIHAVDLRILG